MRTVHLRYRGFFASTVLFGLMLVASTAGAVTVAEDFEGESAGSSTLPSGWTLVTVAGSPTYVTSASGEGSDGSGGSSGLAGVVSSTAFSWANLPGAYLCNTNSNFLTSEPFSGSFDFRIVQESTSDDVTFVFGSIDDGITGTTAGELLSVKFYEGSPAVRIADGTNASLTTSSSGSIADDTWYRSTFTWTPTSGTTGDFTITVSNFTAAVCDVTLTGFTFTDSDGQFGFGSVNDTIRFDNVQIEQQDPTPPPAGFSMQISFTNLPGGATLTNFPALVKLNLDNTGGYGGFLDITDGYDLRFWTNATFTGTELNYEIESFDNTSNSYIWVQVPELTQGSDIWATWGDENYTNQEAYTTNGDVWSEGYVAVWHLRETSGSSISDSTANANHSDGSQGLPDLSQAGQIGSGVELDGTKDYFYVNDNSTLDGMSNLTLSCWVYHDVDDGPDGIFGKRDGSLSEAYYTFYKTGPEFIFDMGDRMNVVDGSTVTNWEYITQTFDADLATQEMKHYLNGMHKSSTNNSITAIADNNEPLNLGAIDTDNYHWDGRLDEMRVSSVARSSNWIWACYMNQGTNHSSFVEYGSVSVPVGSIVWSYISTSNITTTSAWATATVGTSLDTCVLVWEEASTAPATGVSTNEWDYRLNLGSTNGTVTAQMTGLSPSTDYVWRYFGDDGSTNGWSGGVAFTTYGPPSVELVNGITVVSGAIKLDGRVVEDGEETPVVRIYLTAGTDPGATTSGWDTNFTITGWAEGVTFSNTVSDLLFGTEYFYRVYASNSYGEAWSSATNFTPAIGIDIGDGFWDDPGEDNANGLQIEAALFGKIGTGGGEKSVTVSGVTFTLNPGGAETVGAWADYSNIKDEVTRYSAAVPWTIEGLTPGDEYNLVFLSAFNSQPGRFTVAGVGAATPDADGDGNFEDVRADNLSVISGTWDILDSVNYSTFTGLLLEYQKPNASAGSVFMFK